MKVKVYVLDVPFPSWARKAVIGAVGIAVFGIGIALAAPRISPGTPWGASETLTATDLNDTFAKVHIASANGETYSVGPTLYCGFTAPMNVPSINGYAGAKSLCEKTCGSKTAHMCTGDELVRTGQLGTTLNFTGASQGWYSTGTYVMVNFSNNTVIQDCDGWTYSGTAVNGAAWTNNTVLNQSGQAVPSGFVTASPCNASNPVLCCD
jgi:hypothetical protein